MIKLLQQTIATALLVVTFIFVLPCASAGTLGPSTIVKTTSGTSTFRAKQVILVFSSDFEGTVGGIDFTWAAGGSVNFGPFDYDTINSITYTVTAGTLRILYI